MIKKTWTWLKKIFFFIFIFHIGWFLFFIWEKFSVTDFIVVNLKLKMLLLIGGSVVMSLVYYFLLRRFSFFRTVAFVLRELFFIAYISSVFYLILGLVFNPPITITQLVSVIQGNGLNRNYLSFDDMSPNIRLAVIASEDQYFADHDGFDLKAIKRAMKYNQQHTKRKQGASTISQQTAKNIFLWQGGGFLRKGLEVFFTFSIEKIWTKKIILERYLNIIEMGRGLFGIEATAQKYFHKDAKDLSRAEAAQVAACLPNPKHFTIRPMSNYISNRYKDIMTQMSLIESDPDIQDVIK